jgi:hypothetical protein
VKEEERKKLPQWARDRLEAQDAMGEMETTPPVGVSIVAILYILFLIGFFVVGCVVIYLVGKAVIG